MLLNDEIFSDIICNVGGTILYLHSFYKNTIIFITHDFGVVADVADRVVVMCKGKIIEEGGTIKYLLMISLILLAKNINVFLLVMLL